LPKTILGIYIATPSTLIKERVTSCYLRYLNSPVRD